MWPCSLLRDWPLPTLGGDQVATGSVLGVGGGAQTPGAILLAAEAALRVGAAAWGAFLHGRAGERLSASVGRVGFLARELVRELPSCLAEIEV